MLRCYEPEDAPLLKDAVDRASSTCGRGCRGRRTSRRRSTRSTSGCADSRGSYDLGEDFVYGVFSPRRLARPRRHAACTRGCGEGALEIGYWIAADAIGQGYATELSAVLTRVGFEHFGVDRVEIRVDPENERSEKVPREARLHAGGDAAPPAADEDGRRPARRQRVDDVRRGARLLAVRAVRVRRLRRARPPAVTPEDQARAEHVRCQPLREQPW